MIAAAAAAAAVTCAMVAAAYALYALLRDPLTPAGAAALTALAMALLAAVIALMFFGRARSRPHPDAAAHGPAAMLQERLLPLLRAQPLLLVGGGLVAAYFVLRRPAVLALIASNLLGMKVQKQKDRRRGLV